jgi:hypothetical protein
LEFQFPSLGAGVIVWLDVLRRAGVSAMPRRIVSSQGCNGKRSPFASPGAMVIRGFQSMAAVLRSFFMEYQRK